MPTKPKRFCNFAGCANLTEDGYCTEHKFVKEGQLKTQRQRYDKGRPAYYAWYDSVRWITLRKKMLQVYPFCALCERVELAMVVDHVKPHKGDSKLFWDVENLQCLCKHCHAVKTSKEDSWNRVHL